MTAALLRLLTLVALVLMPLGMTGAPAVAQSLPEHHGMSSMGHCDEQQQQQQKGKAPASKMDCTAMCTALPAGGAPAPVPALLPEMPRTSALAVPFASVEPEIATPPPKRG